MLQTFSSINEMKQYAIRNHLKLYLYKGVIYDLTEFQLEHPGGKEVINQYANNDISKILFNPQIHKHNPSVILKLQKYVFAHIQTQIQSHKRTPSSQLIIEKMRKQLIQQADPNYYDIPEDCCIEQPKVIKTHRRLFQSM